MDAHQFPENIDHLIYAVPDLETGMVEIEALFGVRPVIGGKHPQYGTHNALLAIGDSIYLELIAPDTDTDYPDQGTWLEDKFRQPPALVTWVLRVDNISKTRANAIHHGVALGAVQAGQRKKPDGTMLTWTLTDPYAMPHDGAVPFLINWGNTTHPASTLPNAGYLVSLKVLHPNPESVKHDLTALGVDDINVSIAPHFSLIAEIETEAGIVVLV